MIKIYSSPSCGKCRMLKSILVSEGVSFEEIDITKNEDALNELQDRDLLSLPVISKDGEFFSGDIEELKEMILG